jgi:hypothetical protein
MTGLGPRRPASRFIPFRAGLLAAIMASATLLIMAGDPVKPTGVQPAPSSEPAGQTYKWSAPAAPAARKEWPRVWHGITWAWAPTPLYDSPFQNNATQRRP